MTSSIPRWALLFFGFLLAPFSALSQGPLADYQRAERLLPQKMRKLVFSGDVTPHWIAKTNRFCYRRVGPKETTFVLVDAEKNTSAPAFDHTQLAAALSRNSRRQEGSVRRVVPG